MTNPSWYFHNMVLHMQYKKNKEYIQLHVATENLSFFFYLDDLDVNLFWQAQLFMRLLYLFTIHQTVSTALLTQLLIRLRFTLLMSLNSLNWFLVYHWPWTWVMYFYTESSGLTRSINITVIYWWWYWKQIIQKYTHKTFGNSVRSWRNITVMK